MNQYLTGDQGDSLFKFRTTHNGNTWTLSAHRVFSPEKVNYHTTKIMCHKEEKEGQKFKLIEKYTGLYEFEYAEREYNMRGWNFAFYDKNNPYPVFSSEETNLLKFFKVKEDTYYIQEAVSNKYLKMDTTNERDEYSYYVGLTDNKEEATEFKMEKK